jgi:hypothetical protein
MRTFQDRNFLVWEVYPSAGRHGFSTNPHIIFHCLTQRDIRGRYLELGESEADAERRIAEAAPAALLDLLEQAKELA